MIALDGVVYDLIYANFHWGRSEHTIDGRNYSGEVGGLWRGGVVEGGGLWKGDVGGM